MTDDYRRLGGGRYRDELGNTGYFHCLRCRNQGCSSEHQKFIDIGLNNFFTHRNNSHGCECAERNVRSEQNHNRRNLVWRFALFQGREATEIVGCPDHRLFCYLPMPDYIPVDQRAEFRNAIIHALEEGEENEGQYCIPIREENPNMVFPSRLENLPSWLHSENSPYSVIAFMTEQNLPDSIRFSFGDLEFSLTNGRREQWVQDAMFFQGRGTGGMLGPNGEPIAYEQIIPKRKLIGGRECLSFIVKDIGRGSQVFTLNNHDDLGRTSQLGSNVFGSIKYWSSMQQFRRQIKLWVRNCIEAIDDAIVRVAVSQRLQIYETDNVDGEFTHVLVQPHGDSPWAISLQPFGADAIPCDGDELDFQNDAQHGLQPLRIQIPANQSDRPIIHLLNVQGFGMLNVRNLNQRHTIDIQTGCGENQLQCRPSPQLDNFNQFLEILRTISPSNIERYDPPEILLCDSYNHRTRADLHRQIISNQVDESPGDHISSYRLSRIQNLVNLLIDEEDADEEDSAYLLLENLGETNYGNWDEGNDLDEPNAPSNSIHVSNSAFLPIEGSRLAFVFSVLPAHELSNRLGCESTLSEDYVSDSDSLILLPSGHRLAPVSLLIELGFEPLDGYPGLAMLPNTPFELIRACFDDSNLGNEMRLYRNLSRNFRDHIPTNPTIYGFNPCEELGDYGRLRASSLDRFERMPEWKNLVGDRQQVVELVGNNDERISLLAMKIPLSHPDPHTLNESWVGFYMLLENNGQRRAVCLYDSSREEVVPPPWRDLYEGLGNARAKRFLRYESLNVVMLAFTSCISRESDMPIRQFLESFIPIPFMGFIRDSELGNSLRAVDQTLLDGIQQIVYSSLWLEHLY